MNRKNILLVFGGKSSEHDISISSARNVYAAMDNEKYHVELCYIDRHGKWWLLEQWVDNLETHGGVQLAAVPGAKSFITIPGNRIVAVDALLPILHGKNGEDGTIQGVASMLELPYAGPSLIGAAITMDKEVTKNLLHATAVPVVSWTVWRTNEKEPVFADLDEMFDHEFFVKPARAGSSFGITKVRSETEFTDALQLAAKFDDKILIEPAIKGVEVQVAIIGKEKPVVSDICEIESTADFHDYEDKYNDTSSVQFHIPARLSSNQTARIKRYALEAYKTTECQGMARIDFFVVDEDTEYVNEINSIPGFTSVSVFPKLWQHEGMKYPQLIDRLIELALEK